jgi:flagellar basal body-associated protein FliL
MRILMQRLLARIVFAIALAAVGAWALPALAEGDSSEKSEKSEKPEKAETDSKSEKSEGGEGGEEGGKKDDKDVTGGRFAGDPIYVHITPLVLPVISDQGLEQIVTVIIDVEVNSYDVAEKMHTNMPRVKDTLMRALYGGLGKGNLRDGKLVNVNKIKAKTTAALTEVLGPGAVKEVLVQGVGQRIF